MGRNKPDAADQLRQWMERNGRDYPATAEALGVTRAHISHLLTGGRTPSLTLALRVAEVTGIPVAAWAKESAAS